MPTLFSLLFLRLFRKSARIIPRSRGLRKGSQTDFSPYNILKERYKKAAFAVYSAKAVCFFGLFCHFQKFGFVDDGDAEGAGFCQF